MNFSILFILHLIFFLGISCSSLKTSHIEKGDARNLDLIPDNFETKKVEQKTSFIDKTDEYGLTGLKATNFNIVDLNGDDYSDIILLPSFYGEPQFYLYDIHEKKFKRGPSPFSTNLKASFFLFYDLNKDKVLDAIVGVLNQETELSSQPLRVFHGKKDQKGNLKFHEVRKFKEPSPNASVNLIDYNLDGQLDIFVGNWFKRINKNPFPERDQLFEYKNGNYVEVTNLLTDEAKQNPDKTMLVQATPTYGSQICDIDQNGFPDILTISTNKFKNKMWMNRYKFREQYRYFVDYAQLSGYAGDPEGLVNSQGSGRSFAVACADYNNDTIMDVFLGELSHNYDNEATDKSSLLTGRSLKFPPRFYRTEYFLDNYDIDWHQADRRAIWVDINNDGLLDLLVDNSGYPPHTRLILFEQLPNHEFENKSKEYGLDIVNPQATVIADFNRDGKMDLLTAQTQIRDETVVPRIWLFENNMDLNKNKSIRFFLRGKKANYHGLNAMIIIKVNTPKGIEERRQAVSYSYGSLPPQNEEGLHFGLNEGEQLLSVKVRWPYSKTLNQHRAGLEKVYKIKAEIPGFMNITLCESGEYLIGRRECP